MKFNAKPAARSIKAKSLVGIISVMRAVLTLPALFLAAGAQAAEPPSCQEIQGLCGKAGFTRDLPGGKDLMSKCYQPILQGQSVAGVIVDPDIVKKCNDALNKISVRQRRRHR